MGAGIFLVTGVAAGVAGPAFLAAGWMFLASKLAAAGTVALGFGHYASSLRPGITPKAAAMTAIELVTAANLFGIKKAGAFNISIVPR